MLPTMQSGMSVVHHSFPPLADFWPERRNCCSKNRQHRQRVQCPQRHPKVKEAHCTHHGRGDLPPRPLKSTSCKPQATNAETRGAQMSAGPINPARKELARSLATYWSSTNHTDTIYGPPVHSMSRRIANINLPAPLIVVRSNSSFAYRPRRKLATIAAMSNPTNVTQSTTLTVPTTNCASITYSFSAALTSCETPRRS